MTRQGGAYVLIDVTSLISAENYLLSENRRTVPEDPFARQCFAEVVQSLIFMSGVSVVHPVLYAPTSADFGKRPLLLHALINAGLLIPLRLDAYDAASARRLEDAALSDLQSMHGLTSMTRFVEQALVIDQASTGQQAPLSTRIWDWSSFQSREVRSASGDHGERIPTADGVEDDAFGEWARAAAVMLAGPLRDMAPPEEGRHLMALLGRGMKYRARAEACSLSYQSHPLRRDFSLTFDLTRTGAANDSVFDVIQAVRGIHDRLADAAGLEETHRVKLLQLELPLLGGRLWSREDTGRRDDVGWIYFVASKIRDYRERATDLRRLVENCVTEEDRLRLARDFDTVKRELLERFGFRKVELSEVERQLVNTVASVTQATSGIPKVDALWIAARTRGKQQAFTGAQPFQRFLYREFCDAWKRTRG